MLVEHLPRVTQTDYFSKYVETIPLPDNSALSVAKGFYKTCCRHGAPAHIISDQGRDFVNQVGSIDFESHRFNSPSTFSKFS